MIHNATPQDNIHQENILTHELLTLGEVARILRVSRRTVERLLIRRAIPYVKFVRNVRVKRNHLDLFMQKNMHNKGVLNGK